VWAFDLKVRGGHVDFGAEAQGGGVALVIERVLHPLAGSQHAKDRALKGIVGQIDVVEVDLINEDSITGSGVVALHHALHGCEA
jgi:hypothetical protein